MWQCEIHHRLLSTVKDGEKFDDANKNLEDFWMALKQSDVDARVSA